MSAPGDSDRERRLDEIVAAYLRAVDTGKAPDRLELLNRYPDLAAELQEFFGDEDRFALGSATERKSSPAKPPVVPLGKGDDPLHGTLGLRPAEARRESIGVGSVIGGRYRVFDIKSGGMGRVYLAEDLDAGKPGVPLKVAIKTVADFGEWQEARAARGASVDGALYTNLLARFRREAMAWVRLGMHPNIIWAMWAIDLGAKPYLVMEYADGGDLRAWIRNGRLTVPLAVNFAIQFCEGMKYAVDAAGVVHRDIKPANVLIKDDRILKITDFGLAKAFDPYVEETRAGDSSSPDYTLSEAGAGTRAYMAPEQFRSLRLADTRSDIFSFGATLYEMLTGVQLFASMNAVEMAQLTAPIPGAYEVNPSVPSDLSAIVARCLDYDAERRYRSFDHLLAVLSRTNEALPGRLPIPSDAQHAARSELLTPSLAIIAETYSLISLGRFAEAAECAQRGIDIDASAFQHWVNKGKALADAGDISGALRCFERAMELKPDDARSWSNLGWAKLQLGDAAAGRAAALRAIEIDQEFAEAWMCRGVCERNLDDLASAVTSLRRAAALAPHDWRIYANLGECLAQSDRRGEALFTLKKAVTINPAHQTSWAWIGWLHGKAGRWPDARGAVDRAVALNANDATSWAIRAWVLWASAIDVAAAEESLAKALEIDPVNAQTKAVHEMMVGHNP